MHFVLLSTMEVVEDLKQQLHMLWDECLGDPHICVAILDGPVDNSHPCFAGANLTHLPAVIPSVAERGFASQHGTHVASIIFGQQGSTVEGIAPRCRGLILPVFADCKDGETCSCSQKQLAWAITQAVGHGANVINISGGEKTVTGKSDQVLEEAVRLCHDNNVLVVAAAGNDGCNCLHVPASLMSVLAVGAMDAQGRPTKLSNWGATYQSQGILALGENILGAIPGGRTMAKEGTSYATPIVSGIVALLLSIQRQRGKRADPAAVRDAIIKTALPCNQAKDLDDRRCLVGTLNVPGVYNSVTHGEIKQVSTLKPEEDMVPSSGADHSNKQVQQCQATNTSMSLLPLPSLQAVNPITSIPAAKSNSGIPMDAPPSNSMAESVRPSEGARYCGCGGSGSMQMVYALGELSYDYGSQARLDSLIQSICPDNPSRGLTEDGLLNFLAERDKDGLLVNEHFAQSLIWTVQLDATPIYAISPSGPFAAEVYRRLHKFMCAPEVERISVPGYLAGDVRLMSGQIIPVIIPELRGMYAWSVEELVRSLMDGVIPEGTTREVIKDRIREVLDRIYYDFRNLGVTPQERALNYAATNAYQMSIAVSTATDNDQVLDSIEVETSPICRSDSDCYDVKLRFFNPENIQRARKVYRFTIDVSDVIPVTLGRMRSWSEA
jgi:cyanobactin maturation PatA/PatG family protease